MSSKTRLTIIFIIICSAAFGVWLGLISINSSPQSALQPSFEPAASSSDNTETEPSVAEPAVDSPETLIISKLNVQAKVEQVGIDKQGNMDVPKDPANVAWYMHGAKPGEPGNAVLAGHLDSGQGPAVFYHLNELAPGDEISVTDSQQKEYRYRVVKKELYPFDRFPMDEVFGVSDKTRLNLITCEGDFNQATKNYSHRTVVFAEMVP